MAQVKVKISGGQVFLHHFLTEEQARAYIVGIREMDDISHVYTWIMSIKLDGREV